MSVSRRNGGATLTGDTAIDPIAANAAAVVRPPVHTEPAIPRDSDEATRGQAHEISRAGLPNFSTFAHEWAAQTQSHTSHAALLPLVHLDSTPATGHASASGAIADHHSARTRRTRSTPPMSATCRKRSPAPRSAARSSSIALDHPVVSNFMSGLAAKDGGLASAAHDSAHPFLPHGSGEASGGAAGGTVDQVWIAATQGHQPELHHARR